VALARGLAGDPSLLLLDEPLSALDLKVRRELRGLIREVIGATGVPSLLVTHDAEEADDLADVIIEYDDGRVVGARRGDEPIGSHAPPAEPDTAL
jgi:ABC-type sulfate/molybdate transport systems ATPase subunit